MEIKRYDWVGGLLSKNETLLLPVNQYGFLSLFGHIEFFVFFLLYLSPRPLNFAELYIRWETSAASSSQAHISCRAPGSCRTP